MKKLIKVIASFALAALVAWSIPAAAGIIVTVGKLPTLSDGGDGTKTGEGARRPTACDPGTTATPGVDSTTMSKPNSKTSKPAPSDCGCAPASTNEPPSDPGYDASKCVPIGGGLLYCDDPSMGAGPGAGEGGAYEEDFAATPDGTDEIEALGCASGGDVGPLGLGLLVLGGLAAGAAPSDRDGLTGCRPCGRRNMGSERRVVAGVGSPAADRGVHDVVSRCLDPEAVRSSRRRESEAIAMTEATDETRLSH